MSHSLSEESLINRSRISQAEYLDEETMEKESPSVTRVNILEESSVGTVTSEQESGISNTEFVSTMVPTVIQSSSPVQRTLHTGDQTEQESVEVDNPDNVFIDIDTENISLMYLDDTPRDLSKRVYELIGDRLSTGSYVTCSSNDKSSPESGISNPEDSQNNMVKTQFLQGHEKLPTMKNDSPGDHEAHLLYSVVSSTELLDITEDNTQVTEKGRTKVIRQLYESRSKDNFLSQRTCSSTDWTLTLDSNPSVSNSKLVEMVLYVHNVNGLVLSLIAENDFRYTKESVQDVVSFIVFTSTVYCV